MARNQQIRDRVAFGDDLFRLENQPDGRVRIVPSPNEVPQQGTDVNAALMQPWEDMLTAATNNGLVRLGRDGANRPEFTIPQLDSLSGAVVNSVSSGTTAKFIPLDGFVRRIGSVVWVRFTFGNIATNPTLNVNSTGAAPIHLNGAALSDSNLARQIAPHVLYGFVFDGTVWHMIVPASHMPTMGQGFGTVATQGSTVAKVGALDGFTRRTGSVVWLRFTFRDTSHNPTLNINSTGAAPIQLNGGTLPSGAIMVNGIHGFVFDGTNWQLINPNPAHTHSASDITSGRLSLAQLPSTWTENRVLGVQAANSELAFVQVNHGMMARNSIGTAQLQDLSITNEKIEDTTISQSKLRVAEGLGELGLPTNSTLVDVINRIRSLPVSRLVSVRINITSSAMATALRAPHSFSLGNVMAMQIERVQNNSNALLLTFYSGFQTTNAIRIFKANHVNVAATDATVDAIVWREVPLLNNGRLNLWNMPVSASANRVLAAGWAGSGPDFMQVNQDMMGLNSVGTNQIQNLSVTTAKMADRSVTHSKIESNAVSPFQLNVREGFSELGIPTPSSLVDVINTIRGLNTSRPVSLRFNITSGAVASALRSPLAFSTGNVAMMQIERAQNNSNVLLLTFYSGLQTTNSLRIFTATHANVAATDATVDAIVWRETPLLTNGRMLIGEMPISPTADRVLAVGASNSGAVFRQISHSMMEPNSIGTAQILDNSVTGSKIIDNAISAAKIQSITALARNIAIGVNSSLAVSHSVGNMAIGDNANITTAGAGIEGGNTAVGANSRITSGIHNIAVGSGAQVTAVSSSGSMAIGRENYASHMNAAIISPNTNSARRASQANNTVTLGHSSTTVGGWSAWNNLSDARDKRDASPLKYDPLAFVNALTPKQYRTDYRSEYRCFKEINEAGYRALAEYEKRHRVHEADIYAIEGTDIEWIEDPCILTNNGRIKDMKDVPDYLSSKTAKGRYSTKYLCKYAKSKEVAAQKFKDDDCLKLPSIAESWNQFCKTYGPEAEIDSFIQSCTKLARKARFLMVEQEPDGTYAGNRYHWGFMAQEVEQAAKSMGIDCPAVQYLAHNKDKDGIPEGDDLYTMGYTELIAPLVGAVQQLAGTVKQLQDEIAELKK